MQIQYVFQEEIDKNDPTFRKLEEYCELRNIQFTNRLFDSDKYEEDKFYVTKLPAIHIYYKKQYYETYFPDEHPIRDIRLVYNKLEIEEMEYLAKKQIWDEKLKYIKRMFQQRSLKTDSYSSKKTE
jgi:hypothetical protein